MTATTVTVMDLLRRRRSKPPRTLTQPEVGAQPPRSNRQARVCDHAGGRAPRRRRHTRAGVLACRPNSGEPWGQDAPGALDRSTGSGQFSAASSGNGLSAGTHPTGQPLAVTTVKHEVNALAAFCRDTAVWGWSDVPGKPLFTLRDTPRRPESIPRYLPAHELDAVVSAIYELGDPHQRAALLLVRWSGARRDEIRRLTIDCLDTYSDGHPRLRIPVGKGHAERMIPLHPDAADALKEVIEIAKAQNAIARRDSSVGRVVNHVFVRRGKLLSATTLFDKPLRDICMKLGLVGHVALAPTADRPSARTDSDTPSVPSSLKAVHAFKRSWRSSDTAARTWP